MTKHAKKQTPEEQREEERALAWAQFGQLMHLVSMPGYPPKPKTPPAPPTEEEKRS